jgi:thiamine biosynthesis lipoprotein
MPNFTISFKAMGSHIQAWLNVPTVDDAQILNEVPAWFEDWEQQFSRFRVDSDLSELNRRSGQWVKVSPAMFEVISMAVEAADKTNGLFNPLVLLALQAAGYDHSFDPANFVPGPSEVNILLPDGRRIEQDPETCAIRLPPHAQLDLGGIAKGWSAQEAAYRLATFGPCLVDAGGDMVAFGSPDETDGWFVSVANPLNSDDLCTILLTDSAIATSGRDYRHWQRDGQTLHHIIDPRTGKPATSNVMAASVIAPDAVQAEIWAKAAVIDGRAAQYPTVLIHTDGSVHYNREFTKTCKQEAH